MTDRPKRRKVDLRTFDAVLSEVDRLRRGYRQAGNWNLAQNCTHLTIFLLASVNGFTVRLPMPLRWLGKWVIKPVLLGMRWMPTGAKAPAVAVPPADVLEDVATNEFRAAVHQVDLATNFYPHPLLGKLSVEQWRQLHLIHISHHLSFLVPNG